jgi:hypothetical protein
MFSIFKGISMAMGWLTVLKLVPWGDVIEKAPAVAQGAKKLWQSVGKKPVVATPGASETAVTTVPALQSQVAELQVAVAELHQQMLASSELIGSLAEQNTQLIKRVEVNRVRMLWLFALVLGLGILEFSRFF